MINVYLGSVATENIISGKIFEINQIEYNINPDYSFELPKLSFSTNIATLAVDDIIILAETTDTTKQISFYITQSKKSYKTGLYAVECEHILMKLDLIKCTDIPANGFSSDWCDTAPSGNSGYTYHNFQTGYEQGQYIWGRRYFQVLFLVKMMIRKATGLTIANISSSAIDNVNTIYYTKYYSMGSWITNIHKYSQIGIPVFSALRVGSSNYDDYLSTNWDIQFASMSCLQLLRWLCVGLRFRIDIFSSSYAMNVISNASEPADAAILNQSDSSQELFRKYVVKNKVLDLQSSPEYDFAYGYIDVGQVYHNYTWGDNLETPDTLLVEAVKSEDDTNSINNNCFNVTFPNLFKLYRIGINTNDYSQSSIAPMTDGSSGTGWHDMLLATLVDYYQTYINIIEYEIRMPAFSCMGFKTIFNIPDRKVTFIRRLA